MCRSLFIGLALIAMTAPTAFAQTSPRPKPPQYVAGTAQLPGDWCLIGKTYTLGEKARIMNLTVDRVEFTAGRVTVGDRAYFPQADEKLMVVYYTLHNPRPRPAQVNYAVFDWVAVDAEDQNHKSLPSTGQQKNKQILSMALQPGQKVGAYMVFRVPAAKQVPKLMVKPYSGKVARYDLRGKVKPLAEPFADTSDATGSTAVEEVSGKLDTAYPLGMFDAKLVSANRTTDTFVGRKPRAGHQYLVATVAVTYQVPGGSPTLASRVNATARLGNGEAKRLPRILHATNDATFTARVAPGKETPIRFLFEVPEGEAASALVLYEGETGRRFVIPLSQDAPATP